MPRPRLGWGLDGMERLAKRRPRQAAFEAAKGLKMKAKIAKTPRRDLTHLKHAKVARHRDERSEFGVKVSCAIQKLHELVRKRGGYPRIGAGKRQLKAPKSPGCVKVVDHEGAIVVAKLLRVHLVKKTSTSREEKVYVVESMFSRAAKTIFAVPGRAILTEFVDPL